MKFTVLKESDKGFKEEILITSLEGLKRLQERYERDTLTIDFYGTDKKTGIHENIIMIR